MKKSKVVIRKLLLSHKAMSKKYQELANSKFSFPYVIEIKIDNQMLCYLGTHHIYSTEDKQINSILESWKAFLESGKENRVVLIEGGMRPLTTSINEAITNYSEAGLMVYLANKEEVPIFSPEPDPIFEINSLLKVFSKEEIEYYYFARLVNQWNRLTKKTDFESYISRYLEIDKKDSGWRDFDFSVRYMVEIHNKNKDHKFDSILCKECCYNDSNPSINPVSSQSSLIRDEHIVTEILRLWKENKSIFVVYGSGHAIVQEAALRKLLS